MSKFLYKWTVVAAIAMGSFTALHADAAESGVSSGEIRVGTSLALTGPIKNLGESMRDGMKLYIDNVNREGGVNGRKIKLIVLDDNYDVEKAKANVKKLIEEEQVFSLLGNMGTPTVLATLPIADAARVPFFAPLTGSDQVRATKSPMLYTINAAYSDEIGKILSHLKLLDIDKIGLIYQNNAFGKSGLQAATDAAKNNKQNLIAIAPVEGNSSNVAEAIAKVAAQNPTAVVIATAGKVTVDLVRAYQATGQRAQLYMWSVADVQALHGALGPAVRGIVVSQTLPPPWLATIPVINDYKRATKAVNFDKVDYTHLLGYISAKAFVEAARRTGRELTRERFASTIASAGAMDLGGYRVKFSRDQQNGSAYVELTMLDKNGKFVR